VTSPAAATTTDEPAPTVHISWPWRLASVALVLSTVIFSGFVL
jgi:hypothetical protein